MRVVAGCLLLGALLAGATAQTQTQCDVSVLFESHCPDSRNFIHQDLVPVWHMLEPHCTLDLVPFGKARSTESGFSCQHGQKECRGNMIMSCALSRLSPGRDHLNFVSCFMSDPDDSGSRCAKDSGLQWPEVEACLVSGEGRRLQKEAEAKSPAIQQSRFVPTVLMNKVYSQNYQNDAIGGRFKTRMCQHLNINDCK